MMEGFTGIMELVRQKRKRRVAVVAAQDETVLKAINDAVEEGMVSAVLIGDNDAIKSIAEDIGMNLSHIEIIHEPDRAKASRLAVSLVSGKQADMVMKGLVDTATFLKAVLDKEIGLRTGRLLSHVAVFHVPALNRMLLLTDAAMNISPDLAAKKQILENAVAVAHAIGIKLPKVAPIAAVEVVNPDMPETVDAAILSKMNDRGQIKGCIVDGPLALDNAISMEAATHKGIKSPVAGNADIILVPDIVSGNVMYKTLTYTSNASSGAILSGAAAPVILTSRADSRESKYISIALASLAASNI